MDDDRRAEILLNLARGGTPARPLPASLVLRGDARTLLSNGLGEEVADRLIRFRSRGAAETELDATARLGVRVCRRGDGEYPPELRDHPYGPLLLYLRGELPPRPRVGLVGSRAASSGMIRFAERIGRECGRHAVAVVSGLARGIDEAAHRGALAERGACVGVLGCGLDVVYPADTRGVREAVWDGGTMMSTFPLGTAPLRFHFPLRNRLLAALCDAVVVVQATRDSGSMSTARAALDAGIDVLAVPGSPDDPLAEGTNSLIRDGARPVLGPDDVLEAVLGVGATRGNPSLRNPRPRTESDPVRAAILNEIGSVARGASELVAVTGFPACQVLATLVELELDGAVSREPGGLFLRSNASDRP